MEYTANGQRYASMEYRRCGKSGLKLSALSLGLWHNFGYVDALANCREILLTAFDNGITHFDLANNYGQPAGSAEENFGRILKRDLQPYRDELIISSKAGYYMWQGPYGEWGSKKYLVSSLDQSLKRMGLDYVDIFYHHRPDPDTPIEETMGALDLLVKQGKALYVGISNYQAEEAEKAFAVLKKLGTPCLIHQPKYSMFVRWVEKNLLSLLDKEGVGCIPFSPLAQGLLTNKYLKDIPSDSRVARKLQNGAMGEDAITSDTIAKAQQLAKIAEAREQSLAQMALAWILKDQRITSVLIGASKAAQIIDSIQCLKNYQFSAEELQKIEEILER
ncbi:MAG: L-glyceraldehyde 3-phosphate reductase [Chitinophagaceae bacterium]|jgi:L-glyceraldehyde 3-phosphate reductase|nr:L-glyceraldehyde 3-phosphate reductase [Chitinophagaceae bacterium]